MRILVTGGAGFIGSNVVDGYVAAGHDVSVVDDLSAGAPANVSRRARFHRADVRSGELDAIFAAERPELVSHHAAQVSVRRSVEEPIHDAEINVLGSLNVLEAVRQHNIKSKAAGANMVRSLVIVTSDKCYENREWVWGYRENEPMGGHDPYSTSKGCAELLMSSYNQSFGEPPAASARAGNVIGGGDWAKDRLIPDAVRAFAAGQVLEIRNPHAIRPWQHVLEPLAGYLLLAEQLFDKAAAVAGGVPWGAAGVEVCAGAVCPSNKLPSASRQSAAASASGSSPTKTPRWTSTSPGRR